MRQLWEFLIANPILFFVLAAWVVGAAGNALRTRGAQKRQEARSARRESPERRAEPQPMRQQPPPQPAARPAQPTARTAQPTRGPDEIATEMRRILGLDDEPAAERAPEVMPRRETVHREPQRLPATPEPVPTPLSARAATRMLETQIDSHVGESLSHRKGPRSGMVGAHDSEWGTLGGRRSDPLQVLDGGSDRAVVDLSDLKRVILGAEILGPPLALRDPDQQRMF